LHKVKLRLLINDATGTALDIVKYEIIDSKKLIASKLVLDSNLIASTAIAWNLQFDPLYIYIYYVFHTNFDILLSYINII
jgi:hypothetical protein